MSKTVKLAEYLFTRLRQLDIGAVHGVPGDYNLTLLDFVEPSGLLWVGSANELNAGYAADGYARIKGRSALITTFGVGELSAINAIACAFTERVPLVHIVGTPTRDSQEPRLYIHHTLGDGDYRHFGQMSAHVTVAQASLTDPRSAPKQIDDALEQCLIQSRPVYIEVPTDMVAVDVLADRLDEAIEAPKAVPSSSYDAALAAVLARMYDAKRPVILVDHDTRPLGIVDGVQRIVKTTRWPTFTTNSGKDVVDSTLPNIYGIYRGKWADTKTKQLVDSADLVLCFGPHFSSTNSFAWTSVPPTESTISFTWSGIVIGSKTYRDIPAAYAISQLIQRLDVSQMRDPPSDLDIPRDPTKLAQISVPDSDPIKQEHVWQILASFMRPGDLVFGETGTAGYGAREMPLPPQTRLFTPVSWLSIGYMLPASQGAALAQRELIASSKYYGLKAEQARAVLLIGDGSFQMTVQELATIVRHNLNVVVFLINNDGYTIERCIHGVEQRYNDVSPWRYLKAPSLFGAPDDAYIASARTYGELRKVIGDDALANSPGLRMVEIYMDREDAPAGPLLDMLNKQRDPRSQGV